MGAGEAKLRTVTTKEAQGRPKKPQIVFGVPNHGVLAVALNIPRSEWHKVGGMWGPDGRGF